MKKKSLLGQQLKHLEDFFALHVIQHENSPNRCSIQWVPGLKRQEREADHLPQSSYEVNMRGATLLLPHTFS